MSKNERIKINDIEDFKAALINEGYNIYENSEESTKDLVKKIFNIDTTVVEEIYSTLNDASITYRVINIKEFINYIESVVLFERQQIRLSKKIRQIKRLKIHRIEYERVLTDKDNTQHILKEIEQIKNTTSGELDENEKNRLLQVEKELDKEYLYSKDIDLLKKMIITSNFNTTERYNESTKVKTISVKIPDAINTEYIPAKIGSVEYYHHLKSNIPRIERLIKHLNKYLDIHEESYHIDQSNTLQDTINIAIATYNNKEFKAISGSNNISGFCIAPIKGEESFISCKVNKLGQLGVGYNRVNDSEKKILEEIHKQIVEKVISSEGNLVLYSKWEPCPSCYYVISQFCKKYPKVTVQVKFGEKYGE